MMKEEETDHNDSSREPYGVHTALTDPNAPECMPLFERLWAELGELYGDTGPCQFKPADVEGPGAAFVVSRVGGRPAGCGAIVPLAPGMAEVRRMFVEPWARRRGVALAILRELEAEAARMGYEVVRLETGNRQPGAIRLYEAAGYEHIERYGRHVKDPLSVCFEKRLSRVP